MKTAKHTSKKRVLSKKKEDPTGQLMVYIPRTEEDRKFMSDLALKLRQSAEVITQPGR